LSDGILALSDQGLLHIDEEFRRAKRNLLWFCSFAVVLWLVHVPAEGLIEPPMLGSPAKLDVTWFRGAVWLACLYCFIGFYRQIRDVDRLNSQAIYAGEFASIRKRLVELGDTFGTLCDRAGKIAAQADHVTIPSSVTLQTGGVRIKHAIDNALAEADRCAAAALAGGPNADTARYRLLDKFLAARPEINEGIQREFQMLGQAQGAIANELSGVQRLAGLGLDIAAEVGDIGKQFDRLSDHIRADHRLLYMWYDKYLSYGMFVAATVASGWGILLYLSPRVVSVADRLLKPATGWLVVGALVLGAYVGWHLYRRLLRTARRFRLGVDVPTEDNKTLAP
jgi:hypothetical protein